MNLNLQSLLVWGVISAVSWYAGYKIGRLLLLRKFAASILGVLAFFAALAVLALLANQPSKQAFVEITRPQQMAAAEGELLQVAGTVRPPGARVALIVRPETGPASLWWVQGTVQSTSSTDGIGAWVLPAHLGSQTEGVGQRFHLIALALSEPRWYSILAGRNLNRGQTINQVPAWHQSSPVVVLRVK